MSLARLSAGLVLGGAAFIAASGADAADLGRPAPAAVDYVRVCDAYGYGFFYLPGTETCLKIGGRVRADYTVSERGAELRNRTFYDNDSYFSFLARARVDLEAITNSEIGYIQSKASIYFQNGNFLEARDPVFPLFNRNTAIPSTDLYEAYVRVANAPRYLSTGAVFGRTFSYFNLPYFLTYSNPFTADQRTNLAAATFASGGFLAALSVEDPTPRRGYLGFLSLQDIANGIGENYGGYKYPDLIASLEFSNETFAVKAAAAAHHIIRSPYIESGTLLVSNGIDEWGYALNLGGRFNATKQLSFYGGVAYTSGASSFSGVSADDDRFGGGIGFAVIDGYNNLPGDVFTQTKILSAHIGAGYSFSERWRVAGSFGYADVRDAIDFGPVDFNLYKALALIEYSPAKDFTIGVEGSWFKQDFRNLTPFQNANITDYDKFSAVLRVERRF